MKMKKQNFSDFSFFIFMSSPIFIKIGENMNLNSRIITTLSIIFIAAIAIGSACAAPDSAIDKSSTLNNPVTSSTSWYTGDFDFELDPRIVIFDETPEDPVPPTF